jgi:g-D-glutamyl-meso-diaminopimelate peptidase
MWKANINGVDLNVNFDAKWGTGVKNITYPAFESYIGASPFSENETKALRDFTFKIKPDATVSYHTKGEEIYWEFNQNEKDSERDYNIALALSKVTGYSLKLTPGSAGGYKDWCIQRLKIPSFTIEAGSDSLSHPIGEENIDAIIQKNLFVIQTLAEKLYNYKLTEKNYGK